MTFGATGWADGIRPAPKRQRNNPMRRLRTRDDNGQTMVEFALVLPILLVVLFGIIQFGITFKDYVTLTDAVRAGARTAAVSRYSSDPVADTVARVKNAADLTPASVSVTVTSTWVHGDDVVVTARYPYAISLFGVVVSSGNLTSSTTERVE
jgi:Flp pilus assembly protein TadG